MLYPTPPLPVPPQPFPVPRQPFPVPRMSIPVPGPLAVAFFAGIAVSGFVSWLRKEVCDAD